MRKIFQAVLLLLLAGILAGGCTGLNSEYTLRIIPPRNLELPLQGSWEIVALLQEDRAAAGEPAQEWIGKTLHFSDKYVLLGEHLLSNPRFQVKRVEAEAYLLYHHQAFPEGFRFKNKEIEVFTLSDSHLFFCELLRENDDELLLNLFNNSYLVKKIADEVDETIFSPFVTAEGTTAGTAAMSGTGSPAGDFSGNQTGVLLGLRAPGEDDQGYTGAQYRTLWVALAEGKLAPVLEIGTILFPRRSGFYRLQVVRKTEGEIEEDILLVNNILGQEEEKEEEEDPVEPALDPSRWEGKEGYIHRRIDYIGNDYVSVEERIRQVSLRDGSSNEKSQRRIYAVDSLPVMKAVKFSDLAGPEAVAAMEHGQQKLLQQLGLKEEVNLQDEDNYGLARKMGYWIFKGRINYPQKGGKAGARENGNTDTYKEADYNITVIPPDHVVFYNNLNIPWTRVKNQVPSAIDVFTSPAKDLALVITDKEIIVYRMSQENLAAHPLERIPLKDGEEVIMAEWALGHYVENWTLTCQTYLAREDIKEYPQ